MRIETKKTKYGDTYYILHLKNAEEKKYILKYLKYLLETVIDKKAHFEFVSLIKLIEYCKHNDRCDKKDELSVFIYANEVPKIMADAMVLLSVTGEFLSDYNKKANDIPDWMKECFMDVDDDKVKK